MQNAEKTKLPFLFFFVGVVMIGGFVFLAPHVRSLFLEAEVAQKISAQDTAQTEGCDENNEVTFTHMNDANYAVMLNNRTIGVIKTQNPSQIEMLKSTKCHAYLAVMPDGVGGYINYAIEPTALYQVSFLDESLTEISTGSTNVTDVSPDETTIVGVKTYDGAMGSTVALVLTNIVTGNSDEYEVSGEWGTGGDAFFSPDGTKVAFAVAQGNPSAEASQIMILDIATGKIVPLGDVVKDTVRHVDGWKDAQTPNIR